MATEERGAHSALIDAALDRARRQGQPMYTYATASQWIIDQRPPAFGRQHIRCEPDPPLVVGCWREIPGNYWIETVLWPRELVAVPLPQRDEAAPTA